MGCIVYDGADHRRSRGRHRRRGLSDRGLQRARRRRRLHVRLPARLAAAARACATAATWANACGAFAVSRLLCAPEYPTWEELQFFLENGSPHRALRKDEAINHIHWATTRRRDIPALMALAIDHRIQLEDDRRRGRRRSARRIGDFKVLAVKAAARVADGRAGYGMLLDEKHGREAMFEFARHGFSWLGRPVELPGSRPLRFEFSQDIGSQLVEWPVDHCIKCLCFYHPDDPPELKAEQQQKLRTPVRGGAQGRPRTAGRDHRRQARHARRRHDPARAGGALCARHQAGLVEARAAGLGRAPGRRSRRSSRSNDPWCRGVVLLGLEAPQDELEAAFAATADAPIVKGFAVGRTHLRRRRREVAGRHDRRRGGDRRHGGALRSA